MCVNNKQVVVICGKNALVKRELEETEWPSNSRVIIRGFVSNMDEWMGAVDALVTKAGPGTIAEATIRCGINACVGSVVLVFGRAS